MFIQNVSYEQFKMGNHKQTDNMVALQLLSDRDGSFPLPGTTFNRTYQFRVEDNHDGLDPKTAETIITILVEAWVNEEDVIVQCAAGLSRSGAIVEVGTILGFEETNTPRIPNTDIKLSLLEECRRRNYL